MLLLNPLLKDWIAVTCVLGAVACSPQQTRTSLESLQPFENSKNNWKQVILEAEKKYELARQQGNVLQICTQAELVASAYFYLESYQSKAYQRWKSIEKKDCAAVEVEEARLIKAQINHRLRQIQSIMEQPID